MNQTKLPLEHDLAALVESEIPLMLPIDDTQPEPQIAQRMANIKADLLRRSGGLSGFTETTGAIIRAAIDYVIDAPTLARYAVDELEPDEKTAAGKRIERMLRHAMKIKRGRKLDVILGGEDVDIKTTMNRNWMFSKSSWGHVNLLIAYSEKNATFSAGLAYVLEDHLGANNRDKKRSMKSKFREEISWIVRNTPYPPNFLGMLDRAELTQIVSLRYGTQRVNALLEAVQNRAIPRHAIVSVANQKDALKRIRSNGGARTRLWPKGILVLSGTFIGDRELAHAAMNVSLSKDEVLTMSIDSPVLTSALVQRYAANHKLTHSEGHVRRLLPLFDTERHWKNVAPLTNIN